MRTNAMKKRIYKKYLGMCPLYASELYFTGKISYEKMSMAYYYSLGNNSEKHLIELIYG